MGEMMDEQGSGGGNSGDKIVTVKESDEVTIRENVDALQDKDPMVLTGTVKDPSKVMGVEQIPPAAAGRPALRTNEHGQVDVAMLFSGDKTQLATGLDAIYDLLDRGLAETRGRLTEITDLVAKRAATLPVQERIPPADLDPKPVALLGQAWTCVGYSAESCPTSVTDLAEAVMLLGSRMKDERGLLVGWRCPPAFAVAVAHMTKAANMRQAIQQTVENDR